MLKVGDKVRVVNYVNDEADGEDPNGVTGAIMKRGGGSGLFAVDLEGRINLMGGLNDTSLWLFYEAELELA